MSSHSNSFTIKVDIPGLRLDKFVASNLSEYSRSFLQKLIDKGTVTVNGWPAKSSLKLEVGDIVDITIMPPTPVSLLPKAVKLNIVYENEDLLVIDKPAGLTTHPSPGQTEDTLINAVLSHYPGLAQIGDSMRPGVVHRLDKDTSGLIIVAKNTRAQLELINQFKERSVKKVYLALVRGYLKPEIGVIDAPVGRHPGNRTKMTVVSSGRQARSNYKVIEYLSKYTLVEVRPETGRTHQIRVHFAAIGFPIVGDATYGEKSPLLDRQFLHASMLKFKLPFTDKTIELESELPDDLKQVLKKINAE